MTPREAQSQAAKAVLMAYERDRPAAGHEYDAWVEEQAKALNLSRGKIRRIILDYTDGYLHDLRLRSATYAQRAADALGASLAEAIQTLQAGLRAKKKRAVYDKSIGGLRMIEVEDWATRAACATKLIDIHGGWAPQRIEVDSRHITATVSTEDLLKQLDQMRKEYAQIARLESARALPAAKTAGDNGRTEGQDGGTELLLLADGMHADG